MSQQAEIVHRVPGRIRIKVPHLKNNPPAAHRLHQMASSVKGVKKVEASSVTGSMIVHYDKDSVDTGAQLGEMINDISAILSVALPEVGEARDIGEALAPDLAYLTEHVPALAPLADAFRKVDDTVKNATRGSFDLATLAPLLLGGSFILLSDSSKSVHRSVLIGGLLLTSIHSYIAFHQARRGVRQQAQTAAVR